jgi:hypothetical protein
MNDINASKPATAFWIVAGLGFLWNAFGAYLYTMAKLDPQTVMAAATPELKDYVANMPLWAAIGYGLGIWGSFLGSVLLLLRSRHAVTSFLVSLVGALVSYAGQAMAGVLDPGITIVVLVVIAFLWWFSRNEAAKGTLR